MAKTKMTLVRFKAVTKWFIIVPSASFFFQCTCTVNKSTDEGGEEAIKSEISLVYEIALKRGLGVVFNVVRESGPPHLKNFVTECVCGNITVQGACVQCRTGV